jgi:hypothetical protein
MALFSNSSRRISGDSLRVTRAERPEWLSGAEHLPGVGSLVQCTEGEAEVVRILGKTGDGSRLLELRIADRPRQPFFAAASNVLVAPNGSD